MGFWLILSISRRPPDGAVPQGLPDRDSPIRKTPSATIPPEAGRDGNSAARVEPCIVKPNQCAGRVLLLSYCFSNGLCNRTINPPVMMTRPAATRLRRHRVSPQVTEKYNNCRFDDAGLPGAGPGAGHVFAWFGATAGMDAFFVAFKIPNFLRRLFAEGAFSQAFVPIISEYRERRSHDAVGDLVSRVAGTLGGVLILVSVAGMLASPVVITVFAPGFLYEDSVRFDLASQMLRITFPYILFVSLVAFAAGILNTYGRFATPSLAPVWLTSS